MTRRAWLGVAATGLVGGIGGLSVWKRPGAMPAGIPITVYASPTCGCCREWTALIEQAGLTATTTLIDDVTPVKRQHNVPESLWSCHTAIVAGYVIEGHVPPDLVARIVSERPKILGLAVPGMPAGAPGMSDGSISKPYTVLSFDAGGNAAAYAVR